MRSVHVYPEAHLTSNEWLFLVKVTDRDTGEAIRSPHTETAGAGVTSPIPLTLLKVVWDMQIGDTDTLQDVDDALFLDDIRPGPQVETVWGNWRDIAEGIISGLSPGYTVDDFKQEWSKQDTQAVRQDANRALVIQRGWSIDSGTIHQHEGDGTNTFG